MKEIKISVVDKVASAVGSPVIVCGNSNYKITFTFDNEWGAYQEKTARFTFIRDGIVKYIDVLFSGTSCTAPILSNIERVNIGVYAGDLKTTTGAEIRCRKSILCLGGLRHELPPEDVYNQILEKVSKKLGSEGGNVTGDYYKDGNTFIHEGNLELVVPKINEVLANERLVETATGSAITIESANAPLQSLKLYGKTTQDGTPTPTEPKALKSVGDSGSFRTEINTKNLIDISSIATQTKNGVTFTNNGDGSITVNGTATENISLSLVTLNNFNGGNYLLSGGKGSENINLYVSYYDENFNWLSESWSTSGENPLYNKKYGRVIVAVYIKKGATCNNVTIYPMLRHKSYDNTFEKGKKQPLTMPYTLRSVGDIKDEIDLSRGVLVQRAGVFILNANATPKSYTERYNNDIANNYNTMYFYTEIQENDSTLPMASTDCPAYSTHFNGEMNYNDDIAGVFGSTKSVCFRIPKNLLADISTKTAMLNSVKAWLSDKSIPVYYKLATPIETPLSETELNAYRSLMTNSGNTTILSEADMTLDYYTPKGQALGNLHTQINKDYFKLTQAIIETGGN